MPRGLTGALAASVQQESAAVTAHAAEEWHAGIGGQPLGPLPLTEVKKLAERGELTATTLVWREGQEEWLPVSHFPELMAIVEEAAPLVAVATAPVAAAPFGAVAASPVAGVALAGAALTQEAPPSGARLGDEALVIPARRSGMAAWVAVGVALLFGLTIGFVVFNQEPKEVVRYVTTGQSAEPSARGAAPAPTDSAPQTPEAQPSPSAEGAGGSDKIARVSGALPKASATADKGTPAPGGGLDLGGLAGSAKGPSGSTGSGSSGSAGQQLDSDAISKTVGRYKTSVQRSCWQPALDTRDKDAPSSARVSVTIVVGPSGSVQSVSTSGDPKGYRGLASCIAGRVRGWQFPASGGTTTVNVPFVFAAQ